MLRVHRYRSGTNLYDKPAQLNDIQSYCSTKQPPDVVSCSLLLCECCCLHDLQARSTFTNLLGCNLLEDSLAALKSPVKCGRFGWTVVDVTATFAFLASWSHLLNELPLQFCPWSHQCNRYYDVHILLFQLSILLFPRHLCSDKKTSA